MVALTRQARHASGTPGLRRAAGTAPARLRPRPGTPTDDGLAAALISLVLILLVAVGAWAADADRLSRERDCLDAAPRETVLVRPGDSLWSIAERHAGGDVETPVVISWVMEENGLATPAIPAGARLVVPVIGR